MTVSQTQIDQNYFGDGTTTNFPIPFEFISNDQIKVDQYDSVTEATTTLSEGVDYSLDLIPAQNVVFSTAPDSNKTITVYRDTPRLQEADYIETGAFPAEAHETALDKIVMMIQELDAQVEEGAPTVSTGVVVLPQQTISSSEEITVGNDNTQLVKKIIADAANVGTNVIADGTTNWQELRIIGASDSLPVTISSNTNLKLNGDIELNKGTTLTLVWDEDEAYWLETSRRT